MKLDDNLISASIAHGLTPGVLATWDSRIARTPRVLVPIQLDVLMVRKEGGTWAKTAMQAPDAGTTPAAHTLLAEPFAEREARPPGAYLHWALPDALTRGAGTAHGGDVSFPPVPDRWLVVRVSTPKVGARRALTAWVLESGGAEPVVTPLDAWFEPEDPDRTTTPGAEPLTALGHGDAVWSAYYDNVENRLAFYDDLSDARGPVAYLVCGWHSRHVDDPIGENLSSPTAFGARLDALGWEIDPADVAAAFVYADTRVTAATKLGLAVREATFERVATADAGATVKPVGVREEKPTLLERDGSAVLRRWAARAVSWPELTLYHGAVVGLGWPGPGIGVAPDGLLGGDAGGPPAAGSVTVTVGNTLVEALAARLAHNTGKEEESRILEAVLLGGTAELDAPDAPARIDALLHAAGFAGLPGGTRTEPVTQHAVVPPTSVVPDPSRTAPGVFAGQATPPVRAATSPAAGGTAGTLAGRVQDAAQLRISPQLRHGAMDSVLRQVKDGLRVDSPVRVGVPRPPGADAPAETVASERPLPRFFVPSDPVFLLEGAGRSYKHGFDDLHSETGSLVCRLSGHTVRSLSPFTLSEGAGGAVRGEDLLARGLDHGGIPPECEDLLRELALLDPGGAETAAAVSSVGRGLNAERLQVNARVYAVEQTAWWIARDERRDAAPLLAFSGFDGTLPSPVAVALPVAPWVPLHLDWQVDLYAATDLAGWDLEEVDFDALAATVPAPDAAPVQTLSGRALLGGGAARVAAATVRRVLEQAQLTGGSAPLKPGIVHAFNSPAAKAALEQITAMRSVYAEKAFRSAVHAAGGGAEAEAAATAADLDHVADELEKMDVLVGAMDRFTSMLRSGFVADGTDAPEDGAVPPGFWPVRSGFLKVTRLRLVDAFGQTLDLLGSGPGTPAAAEQVLRSEPLTVADRADLVELAPRFTAPTRLWFRFVSADDDAVDASDAASPVCGFVLPNHLDGDLQLYAADGTALGAVRFDADAGVVWEESPGQPSTIGASPASIVPNRHLAGLAQGLLDWGALDSTPDTPQLDTALSSLLRIIDTSLWSVDPFGHVGEEHLALLVGHPLAVLRGLVRVEVAEPVDPARVAGLRVPVRIGALAHWQDGLLAYLVGDDAHTLHVPDPAVTDFARPIGPHQGFNGQATTTSGYYDRFADDLGVVADPGATPVDHPYVDTSGVLWVQPGQDVHVTMLVEPHGVVSATTGFLPRKQIGMRRAWVAPGLARLAPLFRFGPVLLDPNLIRMPVASDIRGTWSWSHRKDATTWADEPVTNSLGDARLPPDPSEGQEGWLRLTPDEPLP
ncbi:hypothetical protein OEB99_19615 [Actinotalea sp. M2MS4P-6]|uniref:hypothetical protein n=1 Tax=Actinotalea sp. M2MS4P-6 TaxID=2983762 RepID=UPI0021E47210|nr:hypothetical protein [Actinotalea sp. M2MS4P-6]MCV2396524.1 hypothetical protein [Actinotalea sp. M2MS4P-6]